LEYEDKVQLKKYIDQELKDYRAKVDSVYNDEYESCILLAKENT
jgi:exonuclease VII small subunit